VERKAREKNPRQFTIGFAPAFSWPWSLSSFSLVLFPGREISGEEGKGETRANETMTRRSLLSRFSPLPFFNSCEKGSGEHYGTFLSASLSTFLDRKRTKSGSKRQYRSTSRKRRGSRFLRFPLQSALLRIKSTNPRPLATKARRVA